MVEPGADKRGGQADRPHGESRVDIPPCGRRQKPGWPVVPPSAPGPQALPQGASSLRSPIKEARSIDERPAIVDSRERLGDWEADTVLGKQGTGALVTLVERKSRLYLVKRVASKQAGVVRDAIIEMLTPYIEQVHTITFDNGGEFAEHKAIEEALGAETYFAHPYSSWERGLNENSNGLLRQFIPKEQT